MITVLIVAGVGLLMVIGFLSFRKRVTKGCCEPSDTESIHSEKIDQNIKHYPYTAMVHIEGMHCDQCVKKVTAAYAQKGCLAEVSLNHKEAVVHMKKLLSDELLTAIPARIGYDATLIK